MLKRKASTEQLITWVMPNLDAPPLPRSREPTSSAAANRPRPPCCPRTSRDLLSPKNEKQGPQQPRPDEISPKTIHRGNKALAKEPMRRALHMAALLVPVAVELRDALLVLRAGACKASPGGH